MLNDGAPLRTSIGVTTHIFPPPGESADFQPSVPEQVRSMQSDKYPKCILTKHVKSRYTPN